MYIVFIDIKDCIEYIKKRLENDVFISIDIVFDNDLDVLLNNSRFLKDVDKIGGMFQSYDELREDEASRKIRGVFDCCKKLRRGVGDEMEKCNCLLLNVYLKHINILLSILENLMKMKIIFEVRISE
jgi:hypothetical protein